MRRFHKISGAICPRDVSDVGRLCTDNRTTSPGLSNAQMRWIPAARKPKDALGREFEGAYG